MPDNKDQENASSSPALWWQNPAILVPIILALIGIPTTIISNLDKVGQFLQPLLGSPNPAPPNLSPSNSSKSKESFFVIAGSSQFKKDLSQYPKTVRMKIGDSFDDRYRDIKICNSIVEHEKYYLVIGSILLGKDAEDLKNQAKSDGFQKDTYLQPESQIDFKPSNCQQVE